jgi:Skp family chaperone for outer membrane proteins
MRATLAIGLAGAVIATMLAAPGGWGQTPASKAMAPVEPGPAAGASVNGAPAAIPSPIIMVVDPETVLQESTAGQAVRKAHDHYLQIFQNALEAGRKALAARQAELTRQKAVLSQSVWQRKANAFDMQIVDFNRKFQKANLAVEKSYRTAMGELGRAFARVSTEVANRRGANLVLPVQQVILHDRRMDQTAEVIRRMNKEFPSVVFPRPMIDGKPASEYVAVPKFTKK